MRSAACPFIAVTTAMPAITAIGVASSAELSRSLAGTKRIAKKPPARQAKDTIAMMKSRGRNEAETLMRRVLRRIAAPR